MASVQEIRQRLRGQRIKTLRSRIEPLLAGRVGAEVWLFGSLARGDWDARSDVDLLAVAADQSAADQQAEALLGKGLADDPDGDEAPVDLFDERDWAPGPGGGAGRGGLCGSAAWGA
jgi:predicted nucleotidyltransferase